MSQSFDPKKKEVVRVVKGEERETGFYRLQKLKQKQILSSD
jgi:hypothetical protein